MGGQNSVSILPFPLFPHVVTGVLVHLFRPPVPHLFDGGGQSQCQKILVSSMSKCIKPLTKSGMWLYEMLPYQSPLEKERGESWLVCFVCLFFSLKQPRVNLGRRNLG